MKLRAIVITLLFLIAHHDGHASVDKEAVKYCEVQRSMHDSRYQLCQLRCVTDILGQTHCTEICS